MCTPMVVATVIRAPQPAILSFFNYFELSKLPRLHAVRRSLYHQEEYFRHWVAKQSAGTTFLQSHLQSRFLGAGRHENATTFKASCSLEGMRRVLSDYDVVGVTPRD